MSVRISDASANADFADTVRDDRRGDDYTQLAVAYAAVLFFAAISGRMRR